ncbi:hypothetical protein Q5Y72_06475 [Paracoccus sp. 2205BS29-5]|uniref:Uncharacterized protein n=1 Tax=Paracoccus spongiarum TaxID=3064387 RepID=A0ABT9JA86_9RHOB|nr:hypothetical protein [Paracoccus sp. 2205BS29-5]MDP5306733.1 hypothetical protein [Paracoccus sp. 2205BS29-5]
MQGAAASMRAVVAEFITQAHVAARIRLMSEVCAQRRDAPRAGAGSHTLSGILVPGLAVVVLARAAQQAGLATAPLRRFAVRPLDRQAITLGLGAVAPQQIARDARDLAPGPAQPSVPTMTRDAFSPGMNAGGHSGCQRRWREIRGIGNAQHLDAADAQRGVHHRAGRGVGANRAGAARMEHRTGALADILADRLIAGGIGPGGTWRRTQPRQGRCGGDAAQDRGPLDQFVQMAGVDLGRRGRVGPADERSASAFRARPSGEKPRRMSGRSRAADVLTKPQP